MSYLALARKWRPGFFSDVAGQDHVVRALLNALESDRVHHAFLFAGTRGVGKTTIARILSKALNCESPKGGEPCGECSPCVSIDEGRFVDLLEVDAASRTKVDQTRELLENVQYTPTSGRYKIYLIDEVHMLSASSFNALLKTLEEPPPHVKFLLATTDPQKLPVTVLSRCLQFNLKRLPTALISERMAYICEQEKIKADPVALSRLARAANGSMRDGLSLLDQALVFGGGELKDEDAAEMLGSMDPRHLRQIMQAVIDGDAAGLMQHAKQLQELVPDYSAVLDDLAILLQQIAVMHLAGEEALDEDADIELVAGLAGQFDAETVQLLYQIAITGSRDLALAPDPRIGFEMTLLRMLSFRPVAAVGGASGGAGGGASGGATGGGRKAADAAASETRAAKPARSASGSRRAKHAQPVNWDDLIITMNLKGMTLQLARNCVLAEQSDTLLVLEVGKSGQHLLTDSQQGLLTEAIYGQLGDGHQIRFRLVEGDVDCQAARDKQVIREQQADAEGEIRDDPAINRIIEAFDARVVEGTVKPSDSQTRH